MTEHTGGAEPRMIDVWDLPTRLFHWTLTACVAVSLATGFTGGNAMVWHMRSGYAILALVLFRIAWGFTGSRTARFSDFVRGPRAVLEFARDLRARRAAPTLGHNPLGGWMILALLAILAFQAGSGLFANDDIATEGPLYGLVDKRTSDRITGLHETSALVLCALVAVHLAAVAWHRVARGEDLVRPMLTGAKPLPPGAPAPAMRPARTWAAAILLAIAALAVRVLVTTSQ
ncbi:MAG: cytochrome b/b6 domain-containing protein [Gammaproteobacteria bacterium]